MSGESCHELEQEAQRLADEVLFPNALAADVADGVPEMQLQQLVDAGLYGASTTCDQPTIARLIEILASGCLTTTFVWTQHLGASAAAFSADGPVRDELGDDLVSGRKRGGVAFAHMLRSGPPMTTAHRVDGGWLVRGSAPWVTGWGHIDVVHAAARNGDDIVWLLIDAVDSPTLRSTEVPFAVVNATQTRVLQYDDHFVPDHRVTRIANYDEWRANYRLGLRANGSFALGVARRCCTLLGDNASVAALDAMRDRLNTTDPTDYDAMSAARADASLFAVQVATALVAKTGGNAVMMASHAQRLLREAMFTVVQGQTPSIKQAMLAELAPPQD